MHTKTQDFGTKYLEENLSLRGVLSEKHKVDEKSNIEKDLVQAKGELESLKIEVNTLMLEIEEQKQLLNNVNLDKETITTENLSLKEEIKPLKVQIREQQEDVLKSKIESLKDH